MADQGYATFPYIIIQYYTHVFAHCLREPPGVCLLSRTTFILCLDNITSIRDIVVEMTAKNSRNERNVMYALAESAISLFAILTHPLFDISPVGSRCIRFSHGNEGDNSGLFKYIFICDVSSYSKSVQDAYDIMGTPLNNPSTTRKWWGRRRTNNNAIRRCTESNLHNSKATFLMCVVHQTTRVREMCDTEESCAVNLHQSWKLKWSVSCVGPPVTMGLTDNIIVFSSAAA